MKLLNPGPVTTTSRVKQALLSGDLCHREVECSELLFDVIKKIEAVYPTQKDNFRAVVLTGSGTAAVEAMLANCVSADDRVLMIANGVYGQRMQDILERYGKQSTLLDFGITNAINFERVDAELATGKYTIVAVVHHETTIGRLNDLEKLMQLCKTNKVGLLADTVSSFGAEAIDFNHESLLAVSATANKCLHGFPGISFVLVRDDLLSSSQGNSVSLYLDLFNHHEKQKKGDLAFTPAVQVLYALNEALDEFNELGGQAGRLIHYNELAKRLRACLRKIGIDLIIDEDECSSMLSAFRLPQGVTFEALHQHYKSNGFIIYPGQRELYSDIFRIANMGDLNLEDMGQIGSLMTTLKSKSYSETL